MKVCLVDYDGKKPNLALMRLSTYHKQQGDTVLFRRGKDEMPVPSGIDKVYISCLFRWNRQKVVGAYGDQEQIVLGGTGIDIRSRLPLSVEKCEPDYDLYDNHAVGIGFISRGCPNNCPWCVVSEKEGNIHRVSTARDIVGMRKKVVFLDNNFLAMDDCEHDLRWLSENKTKVDFNQGLDARRVDEYRAGLLAKVKWNPEIRFALDTLVQKESIRRTFNLLVKNGINPRKISAYVLIGFNSFESDVERLWYIHSLGGRPIPMGYRDIETGEQPRTGWDYKLYQKYKRLIFRIPFGKSMWEDFEIEVMKGER